MQINNGEAFQTDSKDDGPAITEEPADVQVVSGKAAVFEIKAEGTGLTYQWWRRNR